MSIGDTRRLNIQTMFLAQYMLLRASFLESQLKTINAIAAAMTACLSSARHDKRRISSKCTTHMMGLSDMNNRCVLHNVHCAQFCMYGCCLSDKQLPGGLPDMPLKL